MTRRGNQAAFEMLVQRYQPRLLAFCRHMLGSKEDAEDVLQEVFAAAYNALLADERAINTRPWLYRIARNRSLNHLRKPRPSGQDSMDIFERDNGVTTADTVHKREEFRQIVSDVGELPETQRTALLLREIDALSYEQIAETMDTTIPSVKSLLVRARVSLAEAAEARLLTCAEVRLELGEVAEGLAKTSAPVRRHVKTCKRCRVFRDELRNTTKALAAIYPVGPLVILHQLGFAKLGLAKLGFGGAAASGGAAGGSGAAAGGIAGGAAAATGGAAAAGSAISAVTGTLASKAAAGMAAAAIVTAGAVEVKDVTRSNVAPPPQAAAVSTHPAPPAVKPVAKPKKAPAAVAEVPEPAAVPVAPVTPTETVPAPVPAPAPVVPPETVQEEEGTVALPTDPEPVTTPDQATTDPAAPPPQPPPEATTPTPPPPVVAPPPSGPSGTQGSPGSSPAPPPPPPAG